VRLKGRTTPSRVFTLLSEGGAVTAAHESFLAAYREGRWSDAEALLTSARQDGPAGLASLYAVYEQRIARLKAANPANWDGVYELEEK